MEVSSQQKDVITFIVNKHQLFIEKLIADKHALSQKCEEYLNELRNGKKKDLSFSVEIETLKRLSSNQDTQNEYLQVIMKFITLLNRY